jgi:hypothetical protein
MKNIEFRAIFLKGKYKIINKNKIALADDQELFRKGIRFLLEREVAFNVIFEAMLISISICFAAIIPKGIITESSFGIDFKAKFLSKLIKTHKIF